MQLVALSFESPVLAQQALRATQQLQDRGLLVLHDVVFVSRRHHDRAQVTETFDPTPVAAAVPASLVGALVGAIVAGPLGFLIGGVVGGASAALVARLFGIGIPHKIVAQLRAQTTPGHSVLGLLVTDVAGAAAVEQLHRFQGAHLVDAEL